MIRSESHPLMLSQRFLIGQEVEVVLNADPSHWSHDWRDQTMWVAGVTVDTDKRALDYWLSDCWPVDHRGNMTDGFAESDLAPVVRATKPQLVETARPPNPLLDNEGLDSRDHDPSASGALDGGAS